MQIIDELEPVKRGAYGGAVGYLSFTGDLDTCIHIRTVVVKDGSAHVQAGGGTVADAEPGVRVRRVACNKSRAVLQRRSSSPRRSRTGREAMTQRPRHRQLRLVHLQPRPVPGRARRRDRGRPQRRGDGRRAARARARPRGRLARARARRTRRASRSRRCARFPEAGIPLLGVCLGHQALVEAFGGKVVARRADPRQGRRRSSHDGRTIFEGLPIAADRSAATTR